MKIFKTKTKQPKFDTYEELFHKLGYKRSRNEIDRGLSVDSIRQNKRETILSVSSSSHYGISWLQKALDTRLGIKRGIK